MTSALSSQISWLARWPGLVLAILVCQSAGGLGVLTTETGSSSWYASLAKPSFQPPGWLFGPVWTTLYTLMGIAVWRVVRVSPRTRGVRWALALFALQLVLNAAWSPVFFGAHAIGAALVILSALALVLVATIVTFWRIDRPAAFLLVPYLAWVSFATILNATILHLNPAAP